MSMRYDDPEVTKLRGMLEMLRAEKMALEKRVEETVDARAEFWALWHNYRRAVEMVQPSPPSREEREREAYQALCRAEPYELAAQEKSNG